LYCWIPARVATFRRNYGRLKKKAGPMPIKNCFLCDYSILVYVGTVALLAGGVEREYERYKCLACGEEFDVLIEE